MSMIGRDVMKVSSKEGSVLYKLQRECAKGENDWRCASCLTFHRAKCKTCRQCGGVRPRRPVTRKALRIKQLEAITAATLKRYGL